MSAVFHRRSRFGAVALAVPALLAACQGAPGASGKRQPPPEASEFVCDAGRCLQRHVRLPDDGEWRCAEEEGVAWCAGGEPAAGVVPAVAARGFVCGVRRVRQDGRVERVCVDAAPDHPGGERGRYRCRFLQERGTQRECVEAGVKPRPVSARGVPDCWLDADCLSGACDRGRCAGAAP